MFKFFIMKSISYLTLLISLLLFVTSCDKHMNYSECNFIYNSLEIDAEKLNRKVIILGLDGVRSDAIMPDSSPFLYSLSEKKGVYFTPSHGVEQISYSGPNWSSILTGVHYEKHQVDDNSFGYPNYSEYPTFFEYIESIDSSINTASIVNWTPINIHILSSVIDFSPQIPMSDLEVFEQAQNILLNADPLEVDILFLHFDELDAAGHSYGFNHEVPEYVEVLYTLDSYVESLFNTIEAKRLINEDWLFLVVSDHGGDGTGHGDSSNPHINKTVFFAQHPSINFKHQHTSNQTDLAPTIFDFLGISSPIFNCKTDGISILNYK